MSTERDLNEAQDGGSGLNAGLSMKYFEVRKSWRTIRDMDLPIPDEHKIFIINAAIEIGERDLEMPNALVKGAHDKHMKKYDLAIKTGTYQSQSGEKSRYENVGEIHDGKDGGFYARVNPFRMLGLCMAAIARGDDSMLVSMFAPRDAWKPPASSPVVLGADDDFDDIDQDIPF